MTPSDLQKIADKLPLSEATKRRNLGAGGVASPAATCGDDAATSVAPALGDRPARPIRFRQRTKPKLNRLETEWRSHLRNTDVPQVIFEQAIVFELARGVTYRPDFVVWCGTTNHLTCYEVKGPWATQTGINKFKQAPHEYPMFTWIMAWKDDSGQWQTQEAQP